MTKMCTAARQILPSSPTFFLQIPLWLQRRSEIPKSAQITYGRLSLYALKSGIAFPKLETLAQELGISLRSCQYHIHILKKYNLIHVKRRGQGKSNIYTFPPHIWSQQEAPKNKDIRQDVIAPEKKVTALPEAQSFAHPYINKEVKDNQKREIRARATLSQERHKKIQKEIPETPYIHKLECAEKVHRLTSTRLPEDWGLPVDWIERTHQEFGWTEERIQREAFKFRNYWCSKPGKGAYKTNWYLVWHTWCLRDWEHVRSIQQTAPKASTESFPQDIETCLEELKGDPVWKTIAKRLAQIIGVPHFISWFKDFEYKGFEEDTVFLKAPSKFIRDWVNTHYLTELQQACPYTNIIIQA